MSESFRANRPAEGNCDKWTSENILLQEQSHREYEAGYSWTEWPSRDIPAA